MAVEISVEGAVDLEPGVIEADAARLLEAVDLGDAELSVVLCDDAVIQGLNRDWRDKDAPTDVLSFPQDDGPSPEQLLGDVVISVQTAARQAEEVGHPLLAELRVLLVHGLCHLLGHDHREPAEAAEMQALEQRLLAILDERASGLIARAQ